jgi:hypothetical protein
MIIRGGNGLDFLTPAVFDEYVRRYTLKTITGSCRDYRATATCDFEMDTADKDRQIEMPAIVLGGHAGSRPPGRKNFSTSGRNLPRTSNTVKPWTAATTWRKTFQTSYMKNSRNSSSRNVRCRRRGRVCA